MGCVFSATSLVLSCQAIAACASGQSYSFALVITVKLTFRDGYSKQLAGI